MGQCALTLVTVGGCNADILVEAGMMRHVTGQLCVVGGDGGDACVTVETGCWAW